jgi:hypothetical protein
MDFEPIRYLIGDNRQYKTQYGHRNWGIIFIVSDLLLRFLSPERLLLLSRSLSRSRSLASLSRDLLRRRLEAEGEGDLLCTILLYLITKLPETKTSENTLSYYTSTSFCTEKKTT